jgi:hypothetical protein
LDSHTKESILRNILGDIEFDYVRNEYRDIFAAGYSLVIFIARRAYALFHAVNEACGSEFSQYMDIVTSSNMLAAWLSTHEPPKRMCIVDDTLLYGVNLCAFIEQLYTIYSFKQEEIEVRVFHACKESEPNENVIYDRFNRLLREDTAKKLFATDRRPDAEVQRCSWNYIKAIHASGMPYYTYFPAFRVRLGDTVGKLFATIPERGEKIDKSRLAPPLAEWGFENTTIKLLEDCGVASICLFPHPYARINGKALRGRLDCESAETVCAVRVFINHQLQEVLIIPYISFKSCVMTDDFFAALPEEISSLCRLNFAGGSEGSIAKERHRVAHRLLRYCASYVIGKTIMDELFCGVAEIAAPFGFDDKRLRRHLDDTKGQSLTAAWKCIIANQPPNTTNEHIESCVYQADEEKLAWVRSFEDKISKHRNIRKEYGGWFCYVAYCLYDITKTRGEMIESETRFPGISLEKLKKLLNGDSDEISDFEYRALVFQLCDGGVGVTRVASSDGEIGGVSETVTGTLLAIGEMVCCAHSLRHPGLVFALNEFKKSQIGRHIFDHYATAFARAKTEDYGRSVADLLDDKRSYPAPLGSELLSDTDDSASSFYVTLLDMCERFQEEGGDETTEAFQQFVARSVAKGTCQKEFLADLRQPL